MPAELPGGRGRHGAGIDRVEIAPGRQDVGPAAARRAATGRARRSRPSRPASTAAISAAPQRGRPPARSASLDPAEHGAGAVPRPAPASASPETRRSASASSRSTVSPAVRHGASDASAAAAACRPRARSHGVAPSPAISGSSPRSEIGGERAQQRARPPRRRRAAARARARPAAHRAARPVGLRAEERAARRGSAVPSARTESRRACCSAVAVVLAGAMPQSRSMPGARGALEDLGGERRDAARIAAAPPRNIRRSAARARPAGRSCRRGSAAASDGRR